MLVFRDRRAKSRDILIPKMDYCKITALFVCRISFEYFECLTGLRPGGMRTSCRDSDDLVIQSILAGQGQAAVEKVTSRIGQEIAQTRQEDRELDHIIEKQVRVENSMNLNKICIFSETSQK